MERFSVHQPGSAVHEGTLLRCASAQEPLHQIFAQVDCLGLPCTRAALDSEAQLRQQLRALQPAGGHDGLEPHGNDEKDCGLLGVERTFPRPAVLSADPVFREAQNDIGSSKQWLDGQGHDRWRRLRR